MKSLDDDVREALRRKDPPAGFADRVLARVGASGSEPGVKAGVHATLDARSATRPVMRWVAAAVLVAAVAGGFQYRAIQKQREERLRGEAAKEQVVQALRIAGSKLQLVQLTIREGGS
jgi:NAD(P)H-dependent FMN reductase